MEHVFCFFLVSEPRLGNEEGELEGNRGCDEEVLEYAMLTVTYLRPRSEDPKVPLQTWKLQFKFTKVEFAHVWNIRKPVLLSACHLLRLSAEPQRLITSNNFSDASLVCVCF